MIWTVYSGHMDSAVSASSTPVPGTTPVYQPRRKARQVQTDIRGVSYHLRVWGDPSMVTPSRPPLVMGHGYMDVGASFQFVVDALLHLEGETRYIVAPDWRGFGHSRQPDADTFWFNDYLGDLDALLDASELGLYAEQQPIDLLGHSMGGNIVMVYAGVRPTRIRRLINLEGFGLPRNESREAPVRLARWLQELKAPRSLRPYADADGVAARLRENNPRLNTAKSKWLAHEWAEPRSDGRWHILADTPQKNVSPQLYRPEEILACWSRITAPVLWVEGDESDPSRWWGQRYPREEFETRLTVVPQVERHVLTACGHMLHHDQPEALAQLIQAFLDRT